MTNNPSSFFGALVMIDDALLESQDKNSKIIGRAQGMYAGADLNTTALLMVINYVFTEGSKYSGSSLSVLGRNAVTQNVRELPIVGGTGVFRFAQGFALASTKWFDNRTGDAIVEYNVTVLHYI
ncbi:dirigent protein 23 [Phtheirospermum japonicum]|uniref:Dirigent protein n=1 Tax=Phtheirospermum japonicum TaxID=374723 RepID=A0A830AYF2_9LAMI|nr:dirigent protein 23 [Phtheirospermum japonicum]